jgi:hypothetical protein
MPIKNIMACSLGKDVYVYKDGVSYLYKPNKVVSRPDTLQAGVDTYKFMQRHLNAKKLNTQEMFVFLLKKTRKYPKFSFRTVIGITANTKKLKSNH